MAQSVALAEVLQNSGRTQEGRRAVRASAIMRQRSFGEHAMSAANIPMNAPSPGRSYDDIRAAWRAANLHPLWESETAHKAREGGPAPSHWRWKQIRPL